MRISTKGRYSLEALLYMALLPSGEYASTRTIAENTGLSDGYLEQLFIPLRKAGIVQGIRGPQGGYVPGRPVATITVGEVLRAVEGSLELVECVNSQSCPLREACVSRHTWRELYKEISSCVDTITLHDLVEAYHAMDRVEYVI
ncbi:MAG: Rrf2 family transcriptional regulator [Spirochaetaceae bacterium]|jgi:Rrf2 family protein|nr:Rrf2 family transcriptional regulator [Spirochaetaceae bacterium]